MKSVSFSGGLKLPTPKEATLPSLEILPVPDTLVLPLQQHHGPACTPTVKKGDSVGMGEVIAQSAHSVINAPVSGQIEDITHKAALPDGSTCPAIRIANDRLDTPATFAGQDLKPMGKMFRGGLNDLSPQSLPLLRKIALAQERRIHTLIVNGLDEAYVLGGQSVLLATAGPDILRGAEFLRDMFRVQEVLIAVYAPVARALQDLVPPEGIRIVPCRAKHPQHKEQLLISALLATEYPAESAPEDIGVSTVSVESVYAVAKCIQDEKAFVHKVLTIGVPGQETARVCSVRLGTSIHDVLTALGLAESNLGKVILGGPLTGKALHSLNVPVTKEMHLFCVQTRDDIFRPGESICCKCGYCVQVCPMRLMPFLIAGFSEGGSFDLAGKNDIESCIECGCCGYVCPAHIPLVQWIQFGKHARCVSCA